MKFDRPVRIIKGGLKECVGNANGEAPPTVAEPSERQVQTIVSAWVSDHRRRSEEFRQNYSSILRRAGFLLPRAHSRA